MLINMIELQGVVCKVYITEAQLKVQLTLRNPNLAWNAPFRANQIHTFK